MILRYRRYLPHLEFPNSTYFVTFRLEGALPQSVLENWRFERVQIQKQTERQKRQLTEYEKKRLKYLFSRKVEEYLDQLYEECWLKDPAVAQVVVNTLRHFDGSRYVLHAWCVMPNHVHVVITAISKSKAASDLIPILHSWKSYTAHKAIRFYKELGRSGRVSITTIESALTKNLLIMLNTHFKILLRSDFVNTGTNGDGVAAVKKQKVC